MADWRNMVKNTGRSFERAISSTAKDYKKHPQKAVAHVLTGGVSKIIDDIF
jgi:penicillin-binding protein-related factor A (putative recombinase)